MVKINLDNETLDKLYKKWKDADTDQTFDEYVDNILDLYSDDYFNKFKD